MKVSQVLLQLLLCLARSHLNRLPGGGEGVKMVRGRERGRERQREMGERERQRQRQTDRQTNRETEREMGEKKQHETKC